MYLINHGYNEGTLNYFYNMVLPAMEWYDLVLLQGHSNIFFRRKKLFETTQKNMFTIENCHYKNIKFTKIS